VKGRRQKISDVRHYSGTLIFYEAPHRVLSLLEALEEGLNPSRRAVVCRELTKLYEQVEPGSLSELRQRVEAATLPAKGEFVVLVQGADEQPMQGEVSLDDCLRVLMTELSISKAAEMASAILGLKRNVVYKRALAIRDEGSEL
jgi:16S rRNA (cytidine1402-2'-O)-methyltransferase